MPVTPTSCAASIEARTASAPSPACAACTTASPSAPLRVTMSASRSGSPMSTPSTNTAANSAASRRANPSRSSARTISAARWASRVFGMCSGGVNGSPTAAHSAPIRAQHLREPSGRRHATPRRRQLGMQVVGEWSHRDAELFEERRAVAPEVAPRAQVVAPDDRLHPGEATGAPGKVDSCAWRRGT